MNELTKVFDGYELTIVETNGEPFFLLKDVCEILELHNPRQVKTRLEDDVISNYPIQDSLGRTQQATFVNEDGLYDVILDSRKPEARKFRKWITKDVLPSIRKTGTYEMGNASYTVEDPIKRAERWIEEQKEKLMLEQRVKEYEPKVNYVDKILESKDAVNITQIAKDYGISGQKLNQILHEERVQYKMNGQWLLYGKHQQEGYTKSKTTEYRRNDGSTGTKLHTRWTQKGRLFIHEILKKRGIHPLLERSQINNVG
ncbi:phage antirepressor KilAC domain-containing protein [Gracilibacillus sp. JCM 18860]|uniref:phage antirepressor KilAC domain-containing protein n=1 Tax=Gracilibacillus sp. JCM 18860 TaxID=1306159 RepID=UPI0006D26495